MLRILTLLRGAAKNKVTAGLRFSTSAAVTRMSSKKRGLSAEEKRQRLLELLREKKDFFLLKELEKIAPKEKGSGGLLGRPRALEASRDNISSRKCIVRDG